VTLPKPTEENKKSFQRLVPNDPAVGTEADPRTDVEAAIRDFAGNVAAELSDSTQRSRRDPDPNLQQDHQTKREGEANG
jgi:hypothetical protein